jgi:hypothetical protein
MRCRSCGSSLGSQTFNGEIALHFPGLDGLKKPIVWVFPKVLVCLNCGLAEFAVPDEQVKTLGTRIIGSLKRKRSRLMGSMAITQRSSDCGEQFALRVNFH